MTQVNPSKMQNVDVIVKDYERRGGGVAERRALNEDLHTVYGCNLTSVQAGGVLDASPTMQKQPDTLGSAYNTADSAASTSYVPTSNTSTPYLSQFAAQSLAAPANHNGNVSPLVQSIAEPALPSPSAAAQLSAEAPHQPADLATETALRRQAGEAAFRVAPPPSDLPMSAFSVAPPPPDPSTPAPPGEHAPAGGHARGGALPSGYDEANADPGGGGGGGGGWHRPVGARGAARCPR